MFAIRYKWGVCAYDFKVFETVKAAKTWWTNHRNTDSKPFQDVLFVIPPGVKNPLDWCHKNIA